MSGFNKAIDFYVQAMHFLESAKLASEHRNAQSDKSEPKWINFEAVIVGTSHAFAAELLIKGILLSNNISYQKIHKLDALMKKLPSSFVEGLKDSFESKQSNSENANQTNFDDLLSSHGEMFVKMRYACDKTPPALDMDFTSHLNEGLKMELKSICSLSCS